MKLALCHELTLNDLEASIKFLKDKLDPDEILCLNKDEINDFKLEDYDLYFFHLNLNSELETHASLTRQSLSNDLKLLNPYLEEANIFDDKFAFYQFLLANGFKTPQTKLFEQLEEELEDTHIVKARHGTEKKDFDNYSQGAIEKILNYDDALVQEKIDIDQELKVLFVFDQVYSNSELDNETQVELARFKEQLSKFFSIKNIKSPKIFSLDLLLDKNQNLFFLELNLRPGAFQRFSFSL